MDTKTFIISQFGELLFFWTFQKSFLGFVYYADQLFVRKWYASNALKYQNKQFLIYKDTPIEVS